MRVEEVQAFLAVVQHGSITSAAQYLHITQPALSQQISALEHELGVELITRKKGLRKVIITEAGEHFIPRAEKFITFLEDTKNLLASSPKDTVRFSCVQSLFPVIAYSVSSTMSDVDTSCNFSMMSLNSANTKSALQNYSMDIGVVCSSLFDSNSRFQVRPLFSENLQFVCNKKSNYDGLIRTNNLNPENELYVYWSAEYSRWHKELFGENARPKIRIEHAPMISEFFKDNDSWAIIPVTLAHHMGNDFKTCELDSPPPHRQTYLISRQDINRLYLEKIQSAIITSVQNIPGVKVYVSDLHETY